MTRRVELYFLPPPASHEAMAACASTLCFAFFASILLPLANSPERRQALARRVRITVNGTARTNGSKRATVRTSGSYCFEMMPHNLGSLYTQNCWGLP